MDEKKSCLPFILSDHPRPKSLSLPVYTPGRRERIVSYSTLHNDPGLLKLYSPHALQFQDQLNDHETTAGMKEFKEISS